MMTKLDQIKEFLATQYPEGEYKEGDLWQKIDVLQCCSLQCMDAAMELIDEEDYYDVDFSKDKQVYMLFFTGASNYFPGIWIGDSDPELIDQMPIYQFDLSVGEDELLPIGNFRFYIETLLNEFLQVYKKNDEYMKTALLLQEKVKVFSTEIINKGSFVITPIEDNE